MTFDQMRYFIEIANCGSFSRAAENLYVSQPNLTKYIANMERELDMRLFDRTTRRVTLTAEGRLLLQKTELLYSRLAKAMEQAKLAGRNLSRAVPVTIGVSGDELLPEQVTDILYRLNSSDQHEYFTLVQDSYSGLIYRLREQQYDMVITTDRNLKRSAGLRYLNLRPFSMLLAVHRAHPLAGRAHLKPTDFGDTPVYFALPDGREPSQQVLDSVFHNAGGVINLRLLNTPDDLLRNVQIGGGIALVSSLVDQARYPEILFRHFDTRPGASQFVAWRADCENPAVLRLVKELYAAFPDQARGEVTLPV